MKIPVPSVAFQVERAPRYGRLEVNLTPRITEKSFTYLDILSDRVLYIHDGSERPVDQFQLTILIPTTMGLNLSRNFVMTVTIQPENDPPKIIFPNGPQIEIVPGTARTLTADVMRALDPDSSSSALVFTLLLPLKVGRTITCGLWRAYGSNKKFSPFFCKRDFLSPKISLMKLWTEQFFSRNLSLQRYLRNHSKIPPEQSYFGSLSFWPPYWLQRIVPQKFVRGYGICCGTTVTNPKLFSFWVISSFIVPSVFMANAPPESHGAQNLAIGRILRRDIRVSTALANPVYWNYFHCYAPDKSQSTSLVRTHRK